jgi:alkylated DNA nucleotide flippase Atl1
VASSRSEGSSELRCILNGIKRNGGSEFPNQIADGLAPTYPQISNYAGYPNGTNYNGAMVAAVSRMKQSHHTIVENESVVSLKAYDQERSRHIT